MSSGADATLSSKITMRLVEAMSKRKEACDEHLAKARMEQLQGEVDQLYERIATLDWATDHVDGAGLSSGLLDLLKQSGWEIDARRRVKIPEKFCTRPLVADKTRGTPSPQLVGDAPRMPPPPQPRPEARAPFAPPKRVHIAMPAAAAAKLVEDPDADVDDKLPPSPPPQPSPGRKRRRRRDETEIATWKARKQKYSADIQTLLMEKDEASNEQQRVSIEKRLKAVEDDYGMCVKALKMLAEE